MKARGNRCSSTTVRLTHARQCAPPKPARRSRRLDTAWALVPADLGATEGARALMELEQETGVRVADLVAKCVSGRGAV
jgi:hypothetical protein